MPLTATAPPERIALNRVTFGARDHDVARVQSMGWIGWVMDQLNPPAGDDPACAQILNEARLRITYGERNDSQGVWPAVDEDRPLQSLGMSNEELYKIYSDVNVNRTL